jgi:hypothetical protein
MPIVGSFAGASARAFGFGAISAPPIGNFESIASTTLSSSNTIEFTSIPATFTHLQLRGILRGGVAATGFHQAYMQLNSDTGNNYSTHYTYGDGANTGSGNSVSSNFMSIAAIPGTNNLASTFGGVVIDILDYTNTNIYKTVRSFAGGDDNSAGYVWLGSGNWRNTNAITSIKVYANTGSNVFAQYSSLALYGVKA